MLVADLARWARRSDVERRLAKHEAGPGVRGARPETRPDRAQRSTHEHLADNQASRDQRPRAASTRLDRAHGGRFRRVDIAGAALTLGHDLWHTRA